MRPRTLSIAAGLIFGATAVAAIAQNPPVAQPDPTLLPYLVQSNSVKLPDGRRVHFTCMGRGSPTVILMAGAGDWGATWNMVQPRIAAKTRVCAWDRPGFGFSDGSPAEQTITVTTSDLIAALDVAGFHKPYVLVAHSLGGLEALLMADQRPQQVAGMVLVDPSIPDQVRIFDRVAPTMAQVFRGYTAKNANDWRQCAEQIRSGKVAIGTADPDGCLAYSATYPAALSAALARADSNAERMTTAASFWGAVEKDMGIAVNPARHYGTMPLIVLTATEMQPLPAGANPAMVAQQAQLVPIMTKGHDAIAALSSRGSDRSVPGTSHYIQRIKPDVVTSAVLEVIDQARSQGRGVR